MDFGQVLRRGWGIIKLEAGAIQEVAADAEALLPSVIVIAIGGFLTALWSLNPVAWVVALVLAPIGVFIAAGILHGLALLFGGKGQYLGLFNVLGHGAGLLGWAGVVPFVGWLIQLWRIPIAVLALENVHKLTRGQAIVVVLIPVVLLGACCITGSVVFGFGLAKLVQAFSQAR